MAALPQSVNLFDALNSESDFTELGAEEILLTPYLTLACALLYMMASDGNLGEQESSHLQGVLGGDGKVLSYALKYVQTVPLDKFLDVAPEVLSTKDKWCILTNVSDALLSDGHADEAELALFSRLTRAFGVSEKAFRPSLAILKLKNDKAILGRYAGVKQERQPMTPHFALAASLLYMLTADGSIGAQEIGQLEAVIGEFEGLQNVALKYVRSVKLKPFLDEASVTLQHEQKLYILTNVCDSMLSDGSVARLEDRVFISMVQAFGFDEKSFEPYYQVLETKNFKPFECRFTNRAVHHNTNETEVQKVGASSPDDAANQGVWTSDPSDRAMGDTISRTMQENIQSVKHSFSTQDNVALVGLNATGELNLQQLGEVEDLNNRQKLEKSPAIANQQLLSEDVVPPNMALIESEVRLQNIHEVVGEVHQRLDHFERQHVSFLQIGRTQRYDDSFAPIPADRVQRNRQRAETVPQDRGVVSCDAVDAAFAVSSSVSNQPAATEIYAGAQFNEVDVVPVASQGYAATGAQTLSSVDFGVSSQSRQVRGFHMTRLNYVQVAMAFAALMFAAPISTKTSVSRISAGPLTVITQDSAVAVHDLNQ